MSATARSLPHSAILATLTDEQQQILLARAINNTPACFVDLFTNDRQREGHNDPEFTGCIDINITRLKALIAEAEAYGWRNIQMYFDLRVKHNGSGAGPCMRGLAKNVVPAEKRFEPTARTQENPTTASELPASSAGLDDEIPF